MPATTAFAERPTNPPEQSFPDTVVVPPTEQFFITAPMASPANPPVLF